MDMGIYIANLGKYNEGEAVGEWFRPPIDYEDMKERIGLNAQYEEYAIHDYDLPFQIDEYISIEEVNSLCSRVIELEGSPFYTELKEIQRTWFNSIEELLDNVEDIHCHWDCDSMEDVAMYYIEETGLLGEVCEYLQGYIDYDALGRDMEIEGSFLITSHGIFEYCA